MPNAEKLRERMIDLGISQKELAYKLGIAQPTLSLKINGKRPFYLNEAERIALLLEIPDREFKDYFF